MKLRLTENRELFGRHFSVSVIKSDGREEPLNFKPHVFYKGIVEGEQVKVEGVACKS